MIEYLDGGLVTAGVFLLLVIFITSPNTRHKSKKEGKRHGMRMYAKIMIASYAALLLYQPYSVMQDIKSNSASFKKGLTLKCITESASYLVSKESGWKIYGDSFTKDSLLIRGDRCEE